MVPLPFPLLLIFPAIAIDLLMRKVRDTDGKLRQVGHSVILGGAFLAQALRNGWFWAGVPLMALSFYSLLVLLSWQPISFVIPASALSYVVGTLGAKYILREDVSPARWIGVVLVCAGVALVAAG